MVANGITLKVDGIDVVVFIVADLSCIKELLGRCSTSHTYGCFYCNLHHEHYDSLNKMTGNSRSINDMNENGEKAAAILGQYPDKYSGEFKKITKLTGQYQKCIFIMVS